MFTALHQDYGSAIEDRRQATGESRRASQRQRCFLKGFLFYDEGTAPLTVTVRNMSAGGAKIELGGPHPQSTMAKLLVPKWAFAAVYEIAWYATPVAGVRFIEKLDLTGHSDVATFFAAIE